MTTLAKSEAPELLLPDGYRLCNCALCNKLLSSRESYRRHRQLKGHRPPPVEGRMFGRPYCRRCLHHGGPAIEGCRPEGQRSGLKRTRS